MRKIKEALRLKFVCGLGERDIAKSCRTSRSTVGNYLRRAGAAGLSWREAAELNEDEIEKRLFLELLEPVVARPLPDCEYIYKELRRYRNVNLTLTQLWLEYKEKHPEGYQYTQFCDYYRRWRGKLDYCMRQEHRGGEKAFIDYCDGIPFVNRANGELVPTQLFVIVWGASNYTMLNPLYHRHCLIGSAPTCVPCSISAAFPTFWYLIPAPVRGYHHRQPVPYKGLASQYRRLYHG